MALSASRANMFVEHSMLFDFCNDGKINNPFTVHCSGVVLQFKQHSATKVKRKVGKTEQN